MPSRLAYFGLNIIRSARTKVLLILFMINLAVCIALTASIYRQLSNALFSDLDGRLLTAASAIPYILPNGYIEQATAIPPVLLGDYHINMQRLQQFAQSAGMSYLYVLALKNNEVIYLADSATDTEIAADRFGHFHQPYRDAANLSYRVLTSGESRYGQLKDDFGDFRSLLLFHTTSTGQRYLLGADLDSSAVEQQLRRVFLQTLALGLTLLLFGSLVSWVLASRLTEPLRRFSSAVQRFTLGEFDLRMPVKTHDELGNLATAFNAMGDALHAREHLLRQLAFVDRVTGLPNRTRFIELIEQQISKPNPHFAVAMMNIADFHYVNDCFGFSEGDNVLRSVADRLTSLQPHPLVNIGRISGNDFLLLIQYQDSKELSGIIRQIEACLSEAIIIDDHRVNLAMRFGISCYPEHSNDADSLLRQAEISIFTAKEECQFCIIYNPSREVDRQSQFTLMGDLREAIEQNQLVVQFQPKILVADLNVHSAEALVRWQHPKRGWIPPSLFIAFAEQSGKLRAITEWVIKDVLRQQLLWQEQGIDICVSVNVGVGDVEDEHFVDFIAKQIDTFKGRLSLCLEITETGVMRQPDLMLKNLNRLRQLNIKLSIDDFGTGYSSFAYLAKMPINELKIDQTFVMAMNSTFESISIVRSMIELGHILGLKVVAEGVETLACWQALSVMGCDEIQGYFIAKPMGAKDFTAWLQRELAQLKLSSLPNMASKLQ
ncbi:EAL domain-containing protein [Chitinibacter fontanus]|uniref:EAL domain-containing protein n=1 Tax=Chitinibacter fontanus TaxID=1737446 RepID=A0A7D5ZJV9_9NEIS|nr:EAL domain-containing protein [Chitinibacter fontanus]QLI83067.1 EAL domain-containing protein [Chitinibacter fontanus]